MGKITVPALSTADDMERLLQSSVDDHSGEFVGALDLDVSHIDMRAQVDSVRITEVEIDANSIGVSYEADYSIYHGCKDMDVEDSLDGSPLAFEPSTVGSSTSLCRHPSARQWKSFRRTRG